MSDLIDRQAAIDAIDKIFPNDPMKNEYTQGITCGAALAEEYIKQLPAAEPKACEYYAICRHGRDEDKLRARLKFCEYCNEDADGFVAPLEKNGHAFVRFGINGWELDLKANGWHGSAKIRYCPMCGRDLYVK